MQSFICDKCGQLSFVDNLHKSNRKKICPYCYQKIFRWDNKNLVIEMEIGCSYTDYETATLPLFENLEAHDILEEDFPELIDAFESLKEIWEKAKWGYHGDVQNMRLVELDEEISRETVADSELVCPNYIYIYKDLAIHPDDIYDRPFNKNPEELYFFSIFSMQCFLGEIYQKDFSYKHCESCGRTICEQNPSNGYMLQGHYCNDGESWECNKCSEERRLEHGISEEDFEDSDLPGQFFNYEDLTEHGWQKIDDRLVGSGYSGYADPEPTIDLIRKMREDGEKILINYGSLAIGGLGGYIEVYTKA